MSKIDINDFEVEKECVYQGEKYCVRDNGAVLRYPKDGARPRMLDNKWTFGKVGNHGYLYIASKGIHRIVATAFHGENLSKEYIVDHIDTNKQNNRPENLRWITKEENILNNPNTIDKLQYITGYSIEELKKIIGKNCMNILVKVKTHHGCVQQQRKKPITYIKGKKNGLMKCLN